MVEKLVPYNRMARQHDETVSFDSHRMRVSGVCRSHYLSPLISDHLFGRRPAYLMFRHQLIDDGRELLRRTFDRPTRFCKRYATEIADEFLGQSAKFVRLVSHS